MIQQFDFSNFGPLEQVTAQDLGQVNLIIGGNSIGKTFLLKALYSVIRAQEESGRGNDNRDFPTVLSEKLYWSFQMDKLGDLVYRGAGNRLKTSVTMDDSQSLLFEFGQDTSKKVTPLHNNLQQRMANSIFLPPKEVLSLDKVILKSALQDRAFGFDATYLDLVLALQTPIQRGRNYEVFKGSRKRLGKMFKGRIEYEQKQEKWIYKQGKRKFSINTTAEGIKKIGILDTLLGNGYLSPESIIFIDEPESSLHPTAISDLMDIVEMLAVQGIQFFMASHSYFIVKKLHLQAQQSSCSFRLIHITDQGWVTADLRDGMPENTIIEESIRLYKEEVDLALR